MGLHTFIGQYLLSSLFLVENVCCGACSLVYFPYIHIYSRCKDTKKRGISVVKDMSLLFGLKLSYMLTIML